MQLTALSSRFLVSYVLFMSVTFDFISTALQSPEDLAWDDTQIIPKDTFLETDPSNSLPLDLGGSDSSSIASDMFDISDSDADSLLTWNSVDVILPMEADILTLATSCPMGEGNFGFYNDGSLADDLALQARDDGTTTTICPNEAKDQTMIDPATLDLFLDPENAIPDRFRPQDLTKPKKNGIPPDVMEFGECFLPFLTPCCCEGTYSWGAVSIWGRIVTSIEACSLSM